MAKVINESQVWHSITKALSSRGIEIKHPNDLSKALSEKQNEYEITQKRARTKVEQFIQDLAKEIESDKKDSINKAHLISERTELEIEKIQISISLLKTNLFTQLISIFKIYRLKLKARNLSLRRDKLIRSLKERLANKQKVLENYQEQKERLIGNECLGIKNGILLLERIIGSHELAGAIAELELIENLSKLPANFIVINNVNLKAKEYIRFDGGWLKSTQIDHVVVGPPGVFVIETKNWSRDFLKNGNYQDPYQQVKRARYLCYIFLENHLNGGKVRSIIVHNGNIPKKPEESFTKILKFNEINNYINKHKEKVLTEENIFEIANRLK